jgi:hypothetical protein
MTVSWPGVEKASVGAGLAVAAFPPFVADGDVVVVADGDTDADGEADADGDAVPDGDAAGLVAGIALDANVIALSCAVPAGAAA